MCVIMCRKHIQDMGVGWGGVGHLHGLQLPQQGPSGLRNVGGQVLVARLGGLAALLQVAHLPLQALLPATHTLACLALAPMEEEEEE